MKYSTSGPKRHVLIAPSPYPTGFPHTVDNLNSPSVASSVSPRSGYTGPAYPNISYENQLYSSTSSTLHPLFVSVSNGEPIRPAKASSSSSSHFSKSTKKLNYSSFAHPERDSSKLSHYKAQKKALVQERLRQKLLGQSGHFGLGEEGSTGYAPNFALPEAFNYPYPLEADIFDPLPRDPYFEKLYPNTMPFTMGDDYSQFFQVSTPGSLTPFPYAISETPTLEFDPTTEYHPSPTAYSTYEVAEENFVNSFTTEDTARLGSGLNDISVTDQRGAKGLRRPGVPAPISVNSPQTDRMQYLSLVSPAAPSTLLRSAAVKLEDSLNMGALRVGSSAKSILPTAPMLSSMDPRSIMPDDVGVTVDAHAMLWNEDVRLGDGENENRASNVPHPAMSNQERRQSVRITSLIQQE